MLFEFSMLTNKMQSDHQAALRDVIAGRYIKPHSAVAETADTLVTLLIPCPKKMVCMHIVCMLCYECMVPGLGWIHLRTCWGPELLPAMHSPCGNYRTDARPGAAC